MPFCGKKNIGKMMNFPNNGRRFVVPVLSAAKGRVCYKLFLARCWWWSVITYAYGGAALVAGGVGMMAGGIAHALSSRGLASKQDADNKASYAFGSVNTTLRDFLYRFAMVSVESAVQ
jgi:predicted phage tail protein